LKWNSRSQNVRKGETMSPELIAGLIQFGATGLLAVVLWGGINQMQQMTKGLIDQNMRLIEIIASQNAQIVSLTCPDDETTE